MANQRGYSLLELMISMVVMAIVFLAIIATQLGTLQGYVSARDAVGAAEVGRRTVEILRVQGSQWISNTDNNTPGTFTFEPDDVYDASANTPFDLTNPIDEIRAAPDWTHLVETPVDVRLNRNNAFILGHLGGKFCIFAKGEDMASVFTDSRFSGAADTVGAIRFQIAVVYPGPNAILTNCEIGEQITAAELNDVGAPDGTPPILEFRGIRVAYFGTVVVRRAHLTQFAAGA